MRRGRGEIVVGVIVVVTLVAIAVVAVLGSSRSDPPRAKPRPPRPTLEDILNNPTMHYGDRIADHIR